MRKPIALLVVLFGFVTLDMFCQELTEPRRLILLRENWQRAVERATTPLNKKYKEELTKLKLKYTKSGDLKAALAVDAELKRLTENTAPSAPPQKEIALLQAKSRWKNVHGGSGNGNILVLENGEGKILTSSGDIRPTKVKVLDTEMVQFIPGFTLKFDGKNQLLAGDNPHWELLHD